MARKLIRSLVEAKGLNPAKAHTFGRLTRAPLLEERVDETPAQMLVEIVDVIQEPAAVSDSTGFVKNALVELQPEVLKIEAVEQPAEIVVSVEPLEPFEIVAVTGTAIEPIAQTVLSTKNKQNKLGKQKKQQQKDTTTTITPDDGQPASG